MTDHRDNFRALIEAASDAILIVDKEGFITFANRQVEKIFGYQIDEIIGQPHDILLPVPFRDIHAGHRVVYGQKPNSRHMAPGRKIHGLRKDGTQFPVEVGLSPYSSEYDQQIISIVRDISERILAEEALQKSERRYRNLVFNLDTGIVLHGADTKVLLANHRAQELLGLTEDQMLGKTDIDPSWHFLREDGTQLPVAEYPVNKVISTQKTLKNFVAGIKNPKWKEIVWVIVNAFAEFDDESYLKQIVVTFWDYTQLKLSEAALAKRTYELVRTNQELKRQVEVRKRVEKELREKQQQIAKDLEIAAGIQKSLTPKFSPAIASIRVAWRFEPCELIGGDIFNFQYSGRNHISFYMLDVCGHGVSSALISATVCQFLQTKYEISSNTSKIALPATVLDNLEHNFPFERFDSFFTIVYLTIDYIEGRLIYCNAGHPPPIRRLASGKLEALDLHGPVIGASGNQAYFQEEVQLNYGDKIILYTDGVLDYANSTLQLHKKWVK